MIEKLDFDIQTILAFYRPALRRFSPLTKADFRNRTGLSTSETKRMIVCICRRDWARVEDDVKNDSLVTYRLTADGERVALSMLAAKKNVGAVQDIT